MSTEAYTIDAVSLFHYLLDILPDRANALVERAEAGEVAIDAPFIAVVETLCTVGSRDAICGVQIALTPVEALEKITDESPIRIRGEDPATLLKVVFPHRRPLDPRRDDRHEPSDARNGGVITTDTETDDLGVPVI